MARRRRPDRSPRKPRALARFPPARDLDFLRSPQLEHGAPRISGFWTVGFVWNSLESLVRNEPFQWVTRDPRPIFNSCGPFPSTRSANTRPSFDPKVDRAEPPRQAATAGRAGIMAIDIARVGPGIGMKLTPPSPFGKKLSTERHFLKFRRRVTAASSCSARPGRGRRAFPQDGGRARHEIRPEPRMARRRAPTPAPSLRDAPRLCARRGR